MFAFLGALSPRFWFGLIIITIIAGLGFTAKVYHTKWEAVKVELIQKQSELDQARADLKVCSDRTEELKKRSEEKEAEVKQAQEQAALIAKGHQKIADKILGAMATNPDKCIAAAQLIQDYKAEKVQ